MPEAYFEIRLSVQPKGATGTIVLPKVAQEAGFSYVIVKDGGEEGIIRVDASEEVLNRIAGDNDCQRITAEEVEELRQTYPPPKIKKKYRQRGEGGAEPGAAEEPFELDREGNRIVDDIQTVRAGFYLIDVPVLPR